MQDDSAAPLALLERELKLSQQCEKGPCMSGSDLSRLWQECRAGLDAAKLSESGMTEMPASRGVQIPLCFDSASSRLGLHFSLLSICGASTVFVLTAADDSGALDAWNDKCALQAEPMLRLHIGAVILAVNGIFGDVRRMQQALEVRRHEVQLLVCNPPSVDGLAAVLRSVESGVPLGAKPFWEDVASRLHSASLMGPGSLAVSQALRCTSFDEQQDESLGLTVVVTTSPVPSNPSTELLERVLASFSLVPGLDTVPRVIVCDGYRVVPSTQKRNHKASKISEEEASRYEEFVDRLEAKAEQLRLRVLRLSERQGFGWAVKRALEEVQTEFVMVVQHEPWNLQALS